jgi:two-component system, OmpR family, response regulator MprA
MIRTILVVDDEPDLAAACQRALSRRGWNVALANSRETAVALLGRRPHPVLAIVDRQLPDGDGVEVLRAAAACGIPVIVVTGYATAATRRLTLEEGAAGFLAKPFSVHELLDLVRRIVGDAVELTPGVPPPPPSPHFGLHC